MASPCQLICRNFGQFTRAKFGNTENIQQTIELFTSRQRENNLLVSTIRAIRIDQKQNENNSLPCTQLKTSPKLNVLGYHDSAIRSLHGTATCLFNSNYWLLLQKPLAYIQTRFCGALADRKCWKCDGKTNAETELFFCNCGVVQSVPSDLTYFQALGFPQSFDIDLQKLSTLYKDLQVLLHPDKYSQKSKVERSLSVDQSAFINKAYATLLKPLPRGLYLLELQNDPVEESNTSVDMELLVEIMEMNEDIAEARGRVDAIQEIEKINQERMKNCVAEVSLAFKAGHTAVAKELLIRLKYFDNIDDKIKELYRQQMET